MSRTPVTKIPQVSDSTTLWNIKVFRETKLFRDVLHELFI